RRSASRPKSPMTTLGAAYSNAKDRPIPLDAPVMTTVRGFLSSISVTTSCYEAGSGLLVRRGGWHESLGRHRLDAARPLLLFQIPGGADLRDYLIDEVRNGQRADRPLH